jgi:serine/threonine protein kinase
MDAASHWQRVRELFANSLEQPDDTRERWLRSQCDDADVLAEVRRLLAQRSEPASIFREDAQGLLARMGTQAAADALLDTDVGPYRLRKLLGVGGMGRVYLAERTAGDFSQQVALKLVRSEFATNELRQRFLRERNTLARLAHPNIAQLHDGGVAANGAPYFTLEYIEGEPITRWCDAHACDVRTRVSLMLKVCDAVLHAHRSLIVHRDLKPSNILVNANGEPKLLDFGIAKPLDDSVSETLTNADARPMTRDYAAPEQLLGDPVTTATDIYALGVLLYLLLSGHMPYRRAELGETSWIKAILEDAPEPMERAIDRGDAESIATSRATSRATTPAALKRSLRGDLERIVQRALAKKADSRYPTVDRLADDLRAYVAGRAISGGTRTYRLRKFMRRQWLPLSAGALLFLIVLASAIGLAWEAGQVERQARTTAAVKDFLLDLFSKADPNTNNGKVPTMRDAVDLGAKRLDAIPSTEPGLRAELQVVLGMIYSQLSMNQEAYDMEAAALTVLRTPGSDPLLYVKAARFAAVDKGRLGDFAEAQLLSDEALGTIRRMRNAPVEAWITTLDTANYVAVHRGDRAAQLRLSEEAMRVVDGKKVPPDILADAWAMRADYARKTHDYATALDYYLRIWKLDTQPQSRVGQGMSLGQTLQDLGRYDEAAHYLNETWNVSRQVFGENDARSLRIGQTMAINEAYTNHMREAYAHLKKLLDDARRGSPPRDDVVSELTLICGETALLFEQLDDAEQYFRQTLAFTTTHPNAEMRMQAETESALGYVYMKRGDLKTAESMYESALRLVRENKIPDNQIVEARLAFVRALRGDVTRALPMAKTALEDVVKGQGENSYDTADIHYFYGRILEMAEKLREAETQYRASIASQALMLPPDGMHLFSADARYALGKLLTQTPATLDEGRRFLEQAATLREAALGADHPRVADAREALAETTASR